MTGWNPATKVVTPSTVPPGLVSQGRVAPGGVPAALLPPALLLAATIVFFLWKGLPAPDVDDLFFLGAPLHLAGSGELVNPLLRRWAAGFGTDRYFLQMPLHPHLLAGWLRVFGVSTVAVLGFSWAGYVVGALGLGAWLRRFGWSVAEVCWLLPIYLTLMVWLGQRPDMAAFALLFAGLGILDPRRAGDLGRGVTGFALLGASALCYPMTVVWGVTLVLAEVLPAAAESGLPVGTILRRWLPALGLAVTLVAGLFVVLVRGEVREFQRVFLAHRALRSAPPWAALVKSLLAGNKDSLALPVFLLFPGLAGWAAWGRGVPRRTRALVLGTFAASVIGVGVYYALNARVGFFLGFFISALALTGASLTGGWRPLARLGVFGVFGGVASLWLVQTALLRPPPEATRRAARMRWDAEAPGRTLFVDAAAARYLFDYRLPPGALDLFYADPPPGAAAAYVPGERGALWAVARPWLRYVRSTPPELVDFSKHTLRGRALDTLPREPYEMVVIGDR